MEVHSLTSPKRSPKATPTPYSPHVASRHASKKPPSLTSMDQDGQQSGYDLEITRRISTQVSVPLIASGGGGSLTHFAEALTEGHADAVLAASVFHDGRYTVTQVKQALAARGIPVRLEEAP